VATRADSDLPTLRRSIEAADGARERMARDLHDGAQQRIVAAVIKLQLAQQKWDSDPLEARRQLDAGVASAMAGLQALRELAAGIHPPVLAERGLEAAVEALADISPLPVTLNLSGGRYPAGMEASLYFFVCEALTNVAKHSAATTAAVRIGADAGVLSVDVVDDGVGGIDLGRPGSGMQGMRDRVGALAGTLTVTSSRGGGTALHAEIPLA
jgi:signal transduction histidine kinase